MTIARRQTPALTDQPRLSCTPRAVTIGDNNSPFGDNPRQQPRRNRATFEHNPATIGRVHFQIITVTRT